MGNKYCRKFLLRIPRVGRTNVIDRQTDRFAISNYPNMTLPRSGNNAKLYAYRPT